ncbi:MAG TPA: hypothetical protein QGF02_01060 [Candidatus Babeliales bacterium]|nr:hypothetical protein [Candidatus Babeliales bacterium]
MKKFLIILLFGSVFIGSSESIPKNKLTMSVVKHRKDLAAAKNFLQRIENYSRLGHDLKSFDVEKGLGDIVFLARVPNTRNIKALGILSQYPDESWIVHVYPREEWSCLALWSQLKDKAHEFDLGGISFRAPLAWEEDGPLATQGYYLSPRNGYLGALFVHDGYDSDENEVE